MTDVERSMEGVTTPGDIAILGLRAKQKRKRTDQFIADYYGISLDDAKKLIKKAENAGMIVPR